MYRIGVVLLLIVSVSSQVEGGWVEDLFTNGVNLWGGLKLQLSEVKSKENEVNTSQLEKHVFSIDYGGTGLSFAKIPHEEKMEIDIYYDKVEEGRGKKMGTMIIPVLLGFKALTVGAVMIAAIGGIALKSLLLAKISVLLASIHSFYKFFGQTERKTNKHHYQEFKHKMLSPVHLSYDVPLDQMHLDSGLHGLIDSAPSASINNAHFETYANYPTSVHGIADTRAQITAVETPEINVTDQQQLISLDGATGVLQPVIAVATTGALRRQFTKRISNNNNGNDNVAYTSRQHSNKMLNY